MRTSIRGALLAATIGAALLAAPAGAQALSCGDFVMKDVTLKGDLDCSGSDSGGLVVGADGVTIDLNGHAIIGAGGAEGYLGIENEGYRNVTVKNGAIRAFQDDVFLYNVTNNRVLNVDLGTNDEGNYNGITSNYGSGNRFAGNDIFRAKYAIKMTNGARNKVAGNRLHHASYGVWSQNEAYDEILRNKSFGFSITTRAFYGQNDYRMLYSRDSANKGYEGFHLIAPNQVTIAHSKANENGYAGVYVEGNPPNSGLSATVLRTTANDNGEYGMYAAYGIPSRHNVAVRNNYYNCYMVSCN